MRSLLPAALQGGWDVQDAVTRRARLCELAFAGYRIPRCGEFREMSRLGVPLVVYTDERAHCGEGKVLWRPGEPAPWYGSTFCSEFIGHPGPTSTSFRWLVVGSYAFHLVYRSDSSWMSNVGGTYDARPSWSKDGKTDRATDLLRYPMYAVDYVSFGDEDYAVDLNVCPGVPVEVVNMVGREVLRTSVEEFARERGLL